MMYKLTPVCVLLILGISISIYADPREDFLRERWYDIEIIVFERSPPVPTPELVTRVVEKRVLPSNTLGMLLSDRELEIIGEFSNAVDFDAKIDELFFDNPWHIAPTTTATPSSDYTGNEESVTDTKFLEGCWLHLVNLDEADTGVFDSEEDWIQSLDDTDRRERTRDPRLPDWLPDVWQTFDRNLADLANSLGLCKEDVAFMLDEEFLEFVREETSSDVNESLQNEQVETITQAIVQDAFDAYEHNLGRTALTPQSRILNLQQSANRLRDNGYRIIDHFSWHQVGRARGSENEILVQFGQRVENGFREVEGTVAFSVARFLHLKANLWRFVPQPQSYDPAETEFETPLFFYEIKESRRLALGEVHYYDHPKFGLLVQIRRVPIPVELEVLVEQLNSTP